MLFPVPYRNIAHFRYLRDLQHLGHEASGSTLCLLFAECSKILKTPSPGSLQYVRIPLLGSSKPTKVPPMAMIVSSDRAANPSPDKGCLQLPARITHPVTSWRLTHSFCASKRSRSKMAVTDRYNRILLESMKHPGMPIAKPCCSILEDIVELFPHIQRSREPISIYRLTH